MKLAGISVKEKKSERYDEKSRLWPGFFYYEVDLFNEKKCKSKVTFRGCIGGASLNCINFVVPMNPCPCGNYPDVGRCNCTPFEVQRYLGHISGPIIDRIDICVETPKVTFQELAKPAEENESSFVIRQRVMQARKIQERRYAKIGHQFNAELTPGEIRRFCALGTKEQRFMEQIFETMRLSARAYHRILKVARTIADLAGEEKIQEIHLAEAVCYRGADQKFFRK